MTTAELVLLEDNILADGKVLMPIVVWNGTIIDGHKLIFDGTGAQLFGNYIKWFLLTIITFGIYSFWLSIKMKQWVTKHTHMIPIA